MSYDWLFNYGIWLSEQYRKDLPPKKPSDPDLDDAVWGDARLMRKEEDRERENQ